MLHLEERIQGERDLRAVQLHPAERPRADRPRGVAERRPERARRRQHRRQQLDVPHVAEREVRARRIERSRSRAPVGVAEQASVAPHHDLAADAQPVGARRAGVRLRERFVRTEHGEPGARTGQAGRRRDGAPGARVLQRDLRVDGPFVDAEAEPCALVDAAGVAHARARVLSGGVDPAADVDRIARVLAAGAKLQAGREEPIADGERLRRRRRRLRLRARGGRQNENERRSPESRSPASRHLAAGRYHARASGSIRLRPSSAPPPAVAPPPRALPSRWPPDRSSPPRAARRGSRRGWAPA